MSSFKAHYNLSVMHQHGHGVEKDKKKQVYHLEQAAIGGHPDARNDLGCVELENGRLDRAVKHWIIAANLGHDDALDSLKEGFKRGFVSKEVFASALRGHEAAVDETKSPQREAAEKHFEMSFADKGGASKLDYPLHSRKKKKEQILITSRID